MNIIDISKFEHWLAQLLLIQFNIVGNFKIQYFRIFRVYNSNKVFE